MRSPGTGTVRLYTILCALEKWVIYYACFRSKQLMLVPAGLTASTHRSDFYFDGDEVDEFHEVIEQWTSMSVKCQVCGERIECADGFF